DSGASTQDLHARKSQYEKAVAAFKSCETDGSSMIKSNVALAKAVILVDGRPSTPKEVIAQCGQRAEATGKLLDEVVGLIRFDEGPKRDFESAQSLLSHSKKNEAAHQL